MGSTIEGITGHQGPAVKIGRENETDPIYPLFHSPNFHLFLVFDRLEVVGEVPVQVVASGVVSVAPSLTGEVTGRKNKSDRSSPEDTITTTTEKTQ